MLAATDLLAIWEAGLAADHPRRAALLFAAARPAGADPADVPIGERDAELFALRRELFGAVMPVRLACPDCAEQLEFEFDTRAVPGDAPVNREPITVTTAGWTVRFRLPTFGDLLAIADADDPDGARDDLFARCLLDARHDDEPAEAGELPAEIRDSVDRAAAEADPCALIELAVHCPECGGSTRAELDIASCLWAELDAWAHTALLDVHLLASSYGWTESEVLGMSPYRRRYYLELAGHA